MYVKSVIVSVIASIVVIVALRAMTDLSPGWIILVSIVMGLLAQIFYLSKTAPIN